MNSAKYFDLLARRKSFGENIGVLDFLISYFEKRFFLQTPNQTYAENFSQSKKYTKLDELRSQFGQMVKSDEFGTLLQYLNSVKTVQMTQTYISLVRYLITKINILQPAEKKQLLNHVRSAFITSGDETLFELLGDFDETAIKDISLPESIVNQLTTPQAKKVQIGSSLNDKVFCSHEDLASIEEVLHAHGDELSSEQLSGLAINKAVFKGDHDVYTDELNKLFSSFNMQPIKSISFGSENVLSSIDMELTEECSVDQGLVSIIVSCFNSEDTVAYALESLLAQSYKNIEILVCDDGSEDDSLLEIIKVAKRDSRIKVFRSRANQGTYNIRNALLEVAAGDFITFQDSDDWSHPQRIEEQLSFMVSNDLPVCSTRWLRISPSGHLVFFFDGKIVRFCVVSTMVRRSVFSVVPRFRQSLVAADTEFHEACIKFFSEDKVRILEKPLILGLWGEGSLTKKDGLQAGNNGQVAARRRNYSDIAARQRVLGSSVIPDAEVEAVLQENGIFRAFRGVDLVEVGR